MGQFWTKVFKHKDVRILLLGLDGAGKTTLLYRVKLGEVVTHVPTIGFNVEQIQYKNITFTAWDIGARDKMRPLFRHYYKGTDAVVIVIDSSDRERMDELYCDVLKPALSAEELANSLFLFLVNKRDLPDTMDKDEVFVKLSLKSLKHTWNIIETSAIRGDGLTDSMEWLAAQLGSSQPKKASLTSATPKLQASVNKSSPVAMKGTDMPIMSYDKDKNCDLKDKMLLRDSKDRIPDRDYCARAYSAFKCFFVRPNIHPDIGD